MTQKNIKVGYLVSYDWKLLENSIPTIYDEADIIVLAIDKNKKTWAGNKYEFDGPAFENLIKRLDTANKIEIYEDDFYDLSLSTMQNEVRERNLLAKRLGVGGWHIQLDVDEYLIDFSSFVEYLKRIDRHPNPDKISKPVNVKCNFVTIVKKVSGGYIYVKPNPKNIESFPIATQVPDYQHGRTNGHFNIYTSSLLIHESRARSEEEFLFKLRNWGHNRDFDIESYFVLWKAIDGYNYRFIKNFNPLGTDDWPELAFCPANNISELIPRLKGEINLSKFFLYRKNSRNLARITALFRRLFK